MKQLIRRFVFAAACLLLPWSLAAQTTLFFQGFEVDTDGWIVFGGGAIVRVASGGGSGGYPSALGSFHAELSSTTSPAGEVYTQWGGYSSVFPTFGYETSVDIYLDLSATTTNDVRFDFSSAVNNPGGTHRRDFIFNGGFYNSSDTDAPGGGADRFIFSASNNSGRANSYAKNPSRDPIAITASGWYTFKHLFYNDGSGVLAVDLSIYDEGGTLIKTWTLSDPTDIIGSTVGGNRYGWFVNNEFDFLAIDNSQLISEALIPVELLTFAAELTDDGVLLSWATASETENLGFHIYRSSSAEGEYTRLNDTLIPGAGSSAETHHYSFTDATVEAGKTYWYRLADVDFNGRINLHNPIEVTVDAATSIGGGQGLPQTFALQQNYPNPFNPSTTISFALPQASEVSLAIYSLSGQLIKQLAAGQMGAGHHRVLWDGTDARGLRVASGVYLYVIRAGDYVAQKKLVLAK